VSHRSTSDLTVYFAGGLFNAAQTCFNIKLTQQLEKWVKRIYLPQRDGFEFSKLATTLASHLPPAEVSQALQIIIYLLDLGVFVHGSDVLIVNLDEPLDEGAVIEKLWGRMLEKFVIGFRTDVRSPYGNLNEPLRGMHFFPAHQCHHFIWRSIIPKRPYEVEEQIDILAGELIDTMEKKSDLVNIISIPHTDRVIERAQYLFKLVPDIHSEEGLTVIVGRYLKRKEWILEIAPVISPH
jgi:hypothetical protein